MKTVIKLITTSVLFYTPLIMSQAQTIPNFDIDTVKAEIATAASLIAPSSHSQDDVNTIRSHNLRDGISSGRFLTIWNVSAVGDAVIILDRTKRIYVLDPRENLPEYSSSLTTMGHLLFAEIEDTAN